MNFFVIRRQASMINCFQQKMFLAEDEHRCMNGLLMINVDTMVKVIIYKSHKVSCFYVTEFDIWAGFGLDCSTENFFHGCFHGPNKYKIRVSVHCSVRSFLVLNRLKTHIELWVALICILSIFPASVHQFYANILVFVNVNPFLFTNNQFALPNSSPRDLYIRTLFMVFTCVVTSKPCSHSFFSVKSQSVFPCSHLQNCNILVLPG